MSQKALLEVDSKISELREEIAIGKATFEGLKELDNLIEKRATLLGEKFPSPTGTSQRAEHSPTISI
jgi:hypothetical protein